MNNTSRERFEKFHKKTLKVYPLEIKGTEKQVELLWKFWQAAQSEKAKLIAELVEASDALIDRWDSPLWKDLPHTAEYIHKLRNVVAKAKGMT